MADLDAGGSRRAAAPEAEAFEFTGWDYDRAAAAVALHYALPPLGRFTETLTFEGASRRPPEGDLATRLRLLHLLAGVSYYKAACPSRLTLHYPAGDALLAFVRRVYHQGLAEFAYRNGLALGDRLNFAVAGDAGPAPAAPVAAPPGGVVVPLGGGKDSLVSLACLEAAGVPLRTIAVGQAALIDAVAAASGHAHLRIRRRLDPRLFELNERGAYNGHVPVTAVLAAVLVLGAAFYGYDTIVLSNERSAEAPTRVAYGQPVNHQYSKTLAFERAFQAVLATEAPGVRYFSLLRPWSELAITRRFAGLRRYHGVFSSCNRNFRVAGSGGDGERWCGACPKCRFVFLALAPFLPRDELVAIFGRDLLADPAQQEGFAALLGVGAEKPFECVGEQGECRAAFTALVDRPGWREAAVVRALAHAVPAEPLAPWLSAAPDHAIPPDLRHAALDCLGA